jgi:hypothetical protein
MTSDHGQRDRREEWPKEEYKCFFLKEEVCEKKGNRDFRIFPFADFRTVYGSKPQFLIEFLSILEQKAQFLSW